MTNATAANLLDLVAQMEDYAIVPLLARRIRILPGFSLVVSLRVTLRG
jgi:hypothetical protein